MGEIRCSTTRLRLGICASYRKAEATGCSSGAARGSSGGRMLLYVDDRVLLNAGKSTVDHPLKHWDEGVGGQGVMNVGQALLPALRSQKRQGNIAGRTLQRDVAEPHQQSAVVSSHVQDTHYRRVAQVFADPGADQHKFDHRKRAKAKGDAETLLATADAHIVSEE